MVYRRNLGSLGASFQPTQQNAFVPASLGGLNLFDALSNMSQMDALKMFNLMPTPQGLRVRQGHVEWATNVPGGVRSIVPFEGQAQDNTEDKLFAVGVQGIYEVTANGTTAPVLVMDFYDPEPDPVPEQTGRGVYTHFTSDASEHWLFYADGDAGLFTYEESTGLWAVAAGITGVDVADVAFVNLHKQRVWMIEKDSADAWYLPVDSVAGAATKFTFGSKFTHGGNLVGLYTWSIDGGDGVDDYLVAISRAGDVLIYRGADPETTDWALVGSWYIGEVPNSRRIVTEYGGSFFILSVYGLTDLRTLLEGEDISNEMFSPARKVSEPLSEEVSAQLSSPAWQLSQHPQENALVVVQPFNSSINQAPLQLIQNTLTKGWAYWRNLPMKCMDVWQGRMYFGTEGGEVMLYGGNLDGTLTDGTPGVAREFEVLTAFNPLTDNPLQFKNVSYMRTLMRVSGNYRVNTKAIYDFDLNDKAATPGIAGETNVAIFDTDSWNQSVWGGSPVPKELITGDLGMGRMVATSTVGSTSGYFVLLNWDIIYKRGGPL